jgi:hypothetical protein
MWMLTLKIGLALAALLGAVGAWSGLGRARRWTALGAAVALLVAVGMWRGAEGVAVEVSRPASLWAVAAGMVALTGARFQGVTGAGAQRLLWAGSSALLIGAWVGLGAARPPWPPLLADPQAWLLGLCAVAALSGGLSSVAVAALTPSSDRQLQGEGWVVSAALVAALMLALYGALGLSLGEHSAALTLTDLTGAPVEASVTVADFKAGRPITAPETLSWAPRAATPGWLPWWVLGVAAFAALGGALGAARRALGLSAMGLAGAGAGALGVWLLLMLPGAKPLPDAAALNDTARQLGAGLDLLDQIPAALLSETTPLEVIQVAASRGIEGEQLLGLPTLSAAEIQLQRADAAAAALLCLLAAALAFYQVTARAPDPERDRPGPGTWPQSLHLFDGKLQPGVALLAARDAMQLGALLLWIACALCVLFSFEGAARYTLQPHQGLWLGVSLVAAAAVWGWERAQSRAERADFALWLTLPLLTLLLALLAAVLAASDQYPALRLLP